MLEKRFAFDLELLVVARHLGYRRVIEAPVEIGERFTSTVSIHAVQGIVLDTLAIFYRLHLLKYYDRPHQASIAPGRGSDTAPTGHPADGAGAPGKHPGRSFLTGDVPFVGQRRGDRGQRLTAGRPCYSRRGYDGASD